jgi:hypothetical protein
LVYSPTLRLICSMLASLSYNLASSLHSGIFVKTS